MLWGWMPLAPPLLDPPGYLLVTGYLAFLIASAAAIRHRNVGNVRRLFTGGILLAFLVANLLGAAILPAVHMYKYTRPLDRTASHYELYVVDSDGDELRVDGNLLQPSERETFARRMAARYTEFNRYEVARQLLLEVRTYRRSIERGPRPTRLLSFPNPALMHRWTPRELRAYDRFVGVRIYRHTSRFDADGWTVEHRHRELVASFRVGQINSSG